MQVQIGAYQSCAAAEVGCAPAYHVAPHAHASRGLTPAAPFPLYAALPSPRCPAPERWCPELSLCSVKGLCNALLSSLANQIATAAASASASGSASSSTGAFTATGGASSAAAAAAAAAYVPPPDKAPPKLVLLGKGVAAISPLGVALMMDNVTWNSDWVDPGASAMDAVDGDVSGRIRSLGAGGWQDAGGELGCHLAQGASRVLSGFCCVMWLQV